MKQGFFKDSLVNRLERNELSFESFLEDTEVLISIKRNNKMVTSFVLDHIDELLDYAIFSSRAKSKSTDLSNRAMKIISVNNIKIIYAISDSTKINSLARKILNEHDDCLENGHTVENENILNWGCIIGKFATILETCFNKCPDNINNFRFLPKLLKFCDNIMVKDLFDIIVSSGRDDVKAYLRLIKFQEMVIDIITKWHNGIDGSINIDTILSIYDIFTKYVRNIGSDGNLPPSLVQFALEFLPTDDRKIIEKQWKLANEAIDTENASNFSTLYQNAITAIKGENILNIDPDLEKEISYFPDDFPFFYKYQENALEFLSTLFSCYPSFASQIDGNLLIQTLVDIYENFSCSSFALSAVCTLLLIMIDISDIQKIIVDIFIPVVAKKIKEEDEIRIDDDNEEEDISYIKDNHECNTKSNRRATSDQTIKAKKSTISVSQRAFTLEFARQVVEMCSSNDELKSYLGDQHNFLEICIPKINKLSSFISNDYGGLCIMPNIVRYPSIDAFKSINLNVSVNI